MKLLKSIISLTLLLLIVSGCSSTPKPKPQAVIDATLPIVTLTKNGIFKDMNAIAFEWKSIEDARVDGIYIYKYNFKSKKVDYYKTIPNRFATHFVDTDIKPSTNYSYSFKTYSNDAESRMSNVRNIRSKKVLKSVVWIQSIQNMPRSAKIIWRPHINEKVESYIIQRATLKDKKFKTIATIDSRLNAEYIDNDLKDNFVYRYQIRVLTFDDITSTPSKVVEVVTKPLPDSVTNITASLDQPKMIEINWRKSKTKDFSLYHLYRSPYSDGSYKLIAKLKSNTFTDKIGEDAKEYFYRVSAIGMDGLESIHNKLSIQGVTLVKPKAPALYGAKFMDNRIVIDWGSKDARIIKYIVIKKTKKGWGDTKKEQFANIHKTNYIDTNLSPNTTYYYSVYGVDKYSVVSKQSLEVEVKTPKVIAPYTKQPQQVQNHPTPTKRVVKPKQQDKEVIIPMQNF